uniref:ABC transporter I family member 20 n=1 Tax=Aegilops tauschii TaxID=37682 RepID=M8BS98_AEGTA
MAPTVEIRNLTFTYPGIDGKPPPGAPPLIEDVCFSLEAGQRCLLVGSNGAGKTTILKILGGKHMVDPSMVRVLGRSAFHDTALTSSGDLCYLGGETVRTLPDQAHIWGGNGAVRTCPPCPAYPRRICPNNLGINRGTPLEGKTKSGRFCGQMGCQILGLPLEMLLHLNYILDVDLTWRMHKASDGQRRRVQICMGLLKPFKVLLLDEITVDLDVLARANLLTYLKKECAEQGATIIYATHIFDGLDDWPTHIVYVAHGKLQLALPLEKVKEMSQLSLMRTVERWLRKERDEDRRKRKERKEKGLPAFDKVIEGSRVVNNGWAAGRLTSTIAGEENFSFSSNSVLR